MISKGYIVCRYNVCQQGGEFGVHIEKYQIWNYRSHPKQQIRRGFEKCTGDHPNLPVQWVRH